jgi:hypothetical protein
MPLYQDVPVDLVILLICVTFLACLVLFVLRVCGSSPRSNYAVVKTTSVEDTDHDIGSCPLIPLNEATQFADCQPSCSQRNCRNKTTVTQHPITKKEQKRLAKQRIKENKKCKGSCIRNSRTASPLRSRSRSPVSQNTWNKWDPVTNTWSSQPLLTLRSSRVEYLRNLNLRNLRESHKQQRGRNSDTNNWNSRDNLIRRDLGNQFEGGPLYRPKTYVSATNRLCRK